MCGVHCSAHLSFCREVPEEEVEEKEKEVVVPGTGRVYGPNDGGSTWGVTACDFRCSICKCMVLSGPTANKTRDRRIRGCKLPHSQLTSHCVV